MSSHLSAWFKHLQSLLRIPRKKPGRPRKCDSTLAFFHHESRDDTESDLGWNVHLEDDDRGSDLTEGTHRCISSYHALRVAERIGVGGMGDILRAHESALERELAVKVIAEDLAGNPAAIRRFLDEARMTAALQHPGLVPVYSLGTYSDGRPYFTMKLIHGQSLFDALQQRKPDDRELPRFLRIFEQVCHAVAYCHGMGIVHRDIKPSNIMLGIHGEVFLMDFGLAMKIASGTGGGPTDSSPAGNAGSPPGKNSPPSERPPECGESIRNPFQPGFIYGSPAYMSPEQAAGRDELIDERVDVFALGATLYEILTGEALYEGNSVLELIRLAQKADLTKKLETLSRCNAPPETIAICRQSLEPKRDQRFRNGKDVQTAMTSYLESVFSQAQRDLTRFFNLSPDLFCIAGTDGYFRRVNPNFSRILGYAADELVSRPFMDFVHPDDHERTGEAIRILKAGKPLTQFINRYKTFRGEYRWFEWTAQAIVQEDMIFAVARDITSHIREQDWHSHGDQTPCGLILLKDDSRIVATNRVAENLFGYRAEELLGRPIDSILRKVNLRSSAPSGDNSSTGLNAKELMQGMFLFGRHKNGREFVVNLGVGKVASAWGELLSLRIFERMIPPPESCGSVSTSGHGSPVEIEISQEIVSQVSRG